MHQKIALCASVLALSFAVSTSVSAQQLAPSYDPDAAQSGTLYPGPAPALPPHEIVTSVRSTGLEPLSRPVLFGSTYSLRAANAARREVRVVVDARTGRVLKVHAVLFPLYDAWRLPPPAHEGQPRRVTAVPDGHGPNSRIATTPPGAEASPPNVPAGGLPAVRAPAAAPPRPVAQAGPPPLPRPRPKLAAVDSTGAPPATSTAPKAAPPQAAAPQSAPPGAAASQAAPPQVEAKESSKDSKESETTGAITPPVAPSTAPVPPATPAAAPSGPVEEHE